MRTQVGVKDLMDLRHDGLAAWSIIGRQTMMKSETGEGFRI